MGGEVTPAGRPAVSVVLARSCVSDAARRGDADALLALPEIDLCALAGLPGGGVGSVRRGARQRRRDEICAKAWAADGEIVALWAADLALATRLQWARLAPCSPSASFIGRSSAGQGPGSHGRRTTIGPRPRSVEKLGRHHSRPARSGTRRTDRLDDDTTLPRSLRVWQPVQSRRS